MEQLCEHNGDEINVMTDKLDTAGHAWLTQMHTVYHAGLLTKELTKCYDESHDFQHHVDVLKNTSSILGADEERVCYLAEVAAILHDVCDHKYVDTIEANKQRLDTFLSGITDGDAIGWIIDNISYSKEVRGGYPQHIDPQVQRARNVVSDADKLEAIGTKGINRCYQFTSAFNPALSSTEVTALVLQHCHDKLLGLPSYMRTQAGRSMAAQRHSETKKWVADHS